MSTATSASFPASVQMESPATATNSVGISASAATVTATFQQSEVDFRAALTELVRQADIQSKALDAIHEAMQRELNAMYEKHDQETEEREARRKLNQMLREVLEQSPKAQENLGQASSV